MFKNNRLISILIYRACRNLSILYITLATLNNMNFININFKINILIDCAHQYLSVDMPLVHIYKNILELGVPITVYIRFGSYI